MRREEASRSRWWHQKPETPAYRLSRDERTSRRCEVEDRSRRVDVMSETRVNTTVGRTVDRDTSIRHATYFFVFSYKTLLIDILHILSPSVFFILAM